MSSRVKPASSRTVITKPNHDGSECGVGAGSSSRSSYGAQRAPSGGRSCARRAAMKPSELLELRAADRRLHVGDLQVVADVAVDVLVIVSDRQRAELLAEAGAAGVVLAAGAVTVAAPVAIRARDARQPWSLVTTRRLRPS